MTFEQRPGGDKKANHADMQEEAARGSDPVRGCGTGGNAGTEMSSPSGRYAVSR